MRNFLRLIMTIMLVISAVTFGIFISRILFYVIEERDFNIPFIEILKVSFKAGSAGGLIGGIGIYLIPYFFTKTPRQ